MPESIQSFPEEVSKSQLESLNKALHWRNCDSPETKILIQKLPKEVKEKYILNGLIEKDDQQISRSLKMMRYDESLVTESFLVDEILKLDTEYETPDPSGEMIMIKEDFVDIYIRFLKEPLSHEALEALVEAKKTDIIDSLLRFEDKKDKFKNLDSKVIGKILESFDNVPRKILSDGSLYSVDDAEKIIDNEYLNIFENNWNNFEAHSKEFAEFLVTEDKNDNYWRSDILANNPEKFTEMTQNEIARLLIDSKKERSLVERLSKYPEVDQNELILELFSNRKVNGLFEYFDGIKNFSGLKLEIAEKIIQEGGLRSVLNMPTSFPDLSGDQMWEYLCNSPEDKQSYWMWSFEKNIGKYRYKDREAVIHKVFTRMKSPGNENHLSFEDLKEKLPEQLLDDLIGNKNIGSDFVVRNLDHFLITDYSHLIRWMAKDRNLKRNLQENFANLPFSDSEILTLQKIYPEFAKRVEESTANELLRYLLSKPNTLVSGIDIEGEHPKWEKEDLDSWIVQVKVDKCREINNDLFMKNMFNEIKEKYSKEGWKELLNRKSMVNGLSVFDRRSQMSVELEKEMIKQLRGLPAKEVEQKIKRFSGNPFFSGLLQNASKTYDLFNKYSEEQIDKAFSSYEKLDKLAKALDLPAKEKFTKALFARSNDEVGFEVEDESFFDELENRYSKINENSADIIKDSVWKFSEQCIFPLLLLKSGEVKRDMKVVDKLHQKSRELTAKILLLGTETNLTSYGLPLMASELTEFSVEEHKPNHTLSPLVTDLKDNREWYPLTKIENEEEYGKYGGISYRVLPLTSMEELVDESEELGHCVGRSDGYAEKCCKGMDNILSIQKKTESGWQRVSTAEVLRVGRTRVRVVQHKAKGNRSPEENAQKCLEDFIGDINNEKIELSQNGGETEKSVENRKTYQDITIKYPYLLNIGFIPTVSKMKEVLVHYANLSWKQEKNGRKIRSIFASDGEIREDTEARDGYRFIPKLYIGKDKRKAELDEVIATFGPVFDEVMDPLLKKQGITPIPTTQLFA